jgi:hypothetical protein
VLGFHSLARLFVASSRRALQTHVGSHISAPSCTVRTRLSYSRRVQPGRYAGISQRSLSKLAGAFCCSWLPFARSVLVSLGLRRCGIPHICSFRYRSHGALVRRPVQRGRYAGTLNPSLSKLGGARGLATSVDLKRCGFHVSAPDYEPLARLSCDEALYSRRCAGTYSQRFSIRACRWLVVYVVLASSRSFYSPAAQVMVSSPRWALETHVGAHISAPTIHPSPRLSYEAVDVGAGAQTCWRSPRFPIRACQNVCCSGSVSLV